MNSPLAKGVKISQMSLDSHANSSNVKLPVVNRAGGRQMQLPDGHIVKGSTKVAIQGNRIALPGLS